ncbi:type II toxin-antitoxin system HicB family antitoxin [Desulfarculus baarsii]
MKTATLLYWRDGEMLVGRLQERADVFSQGRSLEELEVNIREVLTLMEELDLEDLPPQYQTKEIALEA